MSTELLDKNDYIVYNSPPFYNSPPILAFSIYQNKHLISYFEHRLESHFFYEGKKYKIYKIAFDVIECDNILIEAIIDLALKKRSAFLIREKMGRAIRCEAFLSDEMCAKGIILILMEEGAELE